MGGWYEAAVEKLKLLYDILRQHILQSEYIQIDESVLPVIDSEKHKARKGYEWCVRDAIRGAVMFYYDRGSRGGKVAREILGAYKRAVQCDGYDAYDQFEKNDNITVYGCWAHASSLMLSMRTIGWRQKQCALSAKSTKWNPMRTRPV